MPVINTRATRRILASYRSRMPRSLVTPAIVCAIALSWAGTWVVGKLAVATVPPLELSAARYVLASLALVAVMLALRTPIRVHGLGPIAVSAVFGYVLYNAFVFIGLTLAPASDGALIVPTMTPVITAVLATFVGERLTGRRIAGFALGSFGAALVILAGAASEAFSTTRLLGDLLMLAGAASWSIYTTLGLITLRDRSPFEVVALATPIGALILLPLGLLERSYVDVPTWSAGIWLDVAYLGVVVTAVSFPLFYWVVRRVGAGPAALTTYLVPVLTLVLAAVVLGERPAPLQLVGAAVILAGVQLATSGARVAARRTAPEAAT
ncbi:MAG: DMT family transporter [Chloroflexi bacterium]|nr:MAG: DMT family transporter [Chloroflexota bacterium]